MNHEEIETYLVDYEQLTWEMRHTISLSDYIIISLLKELTKKDK
jgi:hypothetical protein